MIFLHAAHFKGFSRFTLYVKTFITERCVQSLETIPLIITALPTSYFSYWSLVSSATLNRNLGPLIWKWGRREVTGRYLFWPCSMKLLIVLGHVMQTYKSYPFFFSFSSITSVQPLYSHNPFSQCEATEEKSQRAIGFLCLTWKINASLLAVIRSQSTSFCSWLFI